MIATDNSLAARLDRLEARAAFGELLADYAYGADRHDLDRFMRIWTDDAEWVLGGALGSAKGTEAIRAKMQEVWGLCPETQHWITDITANFSGPDEASGEAHTICHVRNAEGRELFVACDYDNRYERHDGVWLLSACRLEVHWWKAVEMDTLP